MNMGRDKPPALALAYERAHIPSLQGFLHWLATGAVRLRAASGCSRRHHLQRVR